MEESGASLPFSHTLPIFAPLLFQVKAPLRVLFLSSDTGGGHRASAEALGKQVRFVFVLHFIKSRRFAHFSPSSTLLPTVSSSTSRKFL